MDDPKDSREKGGRRGRRRIAWPPKGSQAEVLANEWQREWDAREHPPRDSWSETHLEEWEEIMRQARMKARSETAEPKREKVASKKKRPEE